MPTNDVDEDLNDNGGTDEANFSDKAEGGLDGMGNFEDDIGLNNVGDPDDPWTVVSQDNHLVATFARELDHSSLRVKDKRCVKEWWRNLICN